MKTKTKTVDVQNVQKPLRENRNIPDFMVVHVAEECSEALKRLLLNSINSSSKNPVERRQEVARMNVVLGDLTNSIKNLLDNSLNKFMNKSTR